MSNEVYSWGARIAFGIALGLFLVWVLQYLDKVQLMGNPLTFAFIFGLLAFILQVLSKILGDDT